MAFSEFERARYQKILDEYIELRRPPAHLRSQIDLSSRMDRRSVEIFVIRPFYIDPSQKMEEPIARATYVKKRDIWKVYWQWADLKWHKYSPVPEVATLEDFLEIVHSDRHGYFWG